MSKQVKNVKVKLISIVSGKFKPKNGEEAIIKGRDINILKADEINDIKGLMYVTVMKPNDVDEDNHYYDTETVKKAAHDFLKYNNTNDIDENHDYQEKDNTFVVESYVDENNIWKAVIDFSQNETLMEKAKNNDLHGVSIAGVGEVLNKATLEDIEDREKKYEKVRQIEKKTQLLLDAIYSTIYMAGFDETQVLGEIQLSLSQYEDRIENILKNDITITKSKESPEMTKEEIIKAISEGVQAEFEKRDKNSDLEKANKRAEESEKKFEKALEDIEELKKSVSNTNSTPDPGPQPKKEEEPLEKGCIFEH